MNTNEHKKIDSPFSDIVAPTAQPVDNLSKPPKFLERFWQYTYMRVCVGIFFLLILITIASVMVYTYFFQPSSDNLYDYAPSSAWLYLEFDINEQEWQQLYDRAPQSALRVNEFLHNAGINEKIVPFVSRIALLGFVDESGTLIWAWLLRTQAVQELELYLPSSTYIKRLAPHVLVVTSHNELTKKFKRATQPHRVPLTYTSDTLAYGFLQPKEVVTSKLFESEYHIAHRLLPEMLTLLFPDTVPVTLYSRDNGLVIDIGNSDPLPQNAFLDEQPDTLPAMFDIMIRGANISKTYADLKRGAQLTSKINFFWERGQEFMSTHYGDEWEQIIDVIDAPTTVVAQLPGFEFDLNTMQVVVDIEKSFKLYEQELFEAMIIHTVARTNPQLFSYTLPDNSVAYEHIIKPELFVFNESSAFDSGRELIVNNGTSRIILYPNNSELHIANGAPLLDMYINNKSLLYQVMGSCFLEKDLESIVVSKKILSHAPLLKDFSSLKIIRNNGHVRTCFTFDK